MGDPNDPNTAGEVDIGAGVIGLAVDRQSGYVYCTTYNYLLEVWNPDAPFGLGWSLVDAEQLTQDHDGHIKDEEEKKAAFTKFLVDFVDGDV